MSTKREIQTASVVVACMLSGMAACVSESQTMTRENEAALTDSLLVLTNRYNAAWEAVRPDSIVAFHSDDFEYYFFDARIDELSEEMLREEWIGDLDEYSIDMTGPSVEILGRDAGIVSFLFRDHGVDMAGVVTETEGALSYVFERRAGVWKLVRIHHSGPMPEGLY